MLFITYFLWQLPSHGFVLLQIQPWNCLGYIYSFTTRGFSVEALFLLSMKCFFVGHNKYNLLRIQQLSNSVPDVIRLRETRLRQRQQFGLWQEGSHCNGWSFLVFIHLAGHHWSIILVLILICMNSVEQQCEHHQFRKYLSRAFTWVVTPLGFVGQFRI